jgi:RTX calcium-binding nonapeptide repeat (4 copies)
MRARRVRRNTCALFAIVLVLAPAADAAVVQLHDAGTAIRLVVTGLPGEANRLTIGRAPDGAVTVTDAGATLLVGERCAGSGGTVTCSGGAPGAELYLEVSTSDGNDQLSLAGVADYVSSYVRAGSGDDVVTGGSGRDDLSGDAGDDRIDGGGRADSLGGGLGADVLAGGAGVDTVGYGASHVPVTVTLDGLPGDGAPGEGDHLAADVENVIGTFGSDRLVGSDGPNRLDGGEGDDEIVGAGGDDRLVSSDSQTGGRLVGGPGRDRFEPGSNSTVDARDGEVDRVRCRGLARPLTADPVDRLLLCVPEAQIRGASARVDPSGRIELPMRCYAIRQRCLVRVELRYQGTTLARESLRIKAGRVRPAIRLNALGRRLLREHGTLVVRRRAQSYRTEPAPSMSRPFWQEVTLR